MKPYKTTHWLAMLILCLVASTSFSQVVWTEPFFPRPDQPITVYFDAALGTGGLKDCNCTVYVHTGVITNASTSTSDWKNVVTTWGQANANWAMSPVAGRPNVYKYDVKPSIKGFYGVTGSTVVQKMAFVFRNAAGNKEGKDTGSKDFFLDVYNQSGLLTALITPSNRNQVVAEGAAIPVRAVVSESAELSLVDNGQVLSQSTGLELNFNLLAGTPGNHKVQFIAATATARDTETFNYLVPIVKPAQDPPAGTQAGINYLAPDKVRLSLYAPNKVGIYVIGDFNDWTISTEYLLTRSINGTTHWIDLPTLKAGGTYRFQYVVDGTRRIGDPYSTLVLDPDNDRFISGTTFPNMPAYPNGKTTGIVSVMQPGKAAYPWKVDNFQRPAKEKLVAYELLLRDFTARHDYQSLIDTLNYFQRLGVNAIQLMPINEFEGNVSWGYNPSYHMALDKYYGTPEKFKEFVDACHARGIAVILDVVFNHAFSQSPLAQMYWDDANFRPSVDNPWLNVTPKHEYNVGYDFNHESTATRDFVKQVLKFWLEEYQIDGFRFDLSKGFTQKLTLGNEALFAVYDASRVAIWKDYANTVRSVSPDAYIILEHFADNAEETELTNNGMLVWGNHNFNANEATMGYSNNLSGLDYRTRGWTNPGAINYMESHDEERLMYKNLQFGNMAGGYSVKNLSTALKRQELAAVLFYSIPGPKMLWQFGELGYDYSINHCTNGTVNNACRLDPKPIRWDYLNQPERKQLFEVTRSLLFLRKNYEVFHTKDFTAQLSSSSEKQTILRSADLNVVVAGNFGVSSSSFTVNFPAAGKWYNYFTRDSITVNGTSQTINFQAGQYNLWTSRKLPNAPALILTSTREELKARHQLEVFPNPTQGAIQVRFTLPEAEWVKVQLFNNLGQVVATLAQGQMGAGPQQVQWKEKLSTGLYYLRMQVGRGVLSQAVVVQ
ncbi:MAG TPA: alpha-amylase family glycosyl hydrolase [Haliscomenobacter sp.]|uniref:alpha-amylase family glycosyl hydrolase n=1 Tax=Haliscomenobacter sp. TaxID=2717303 RepID=UPI002C82016C|nr:alpha-amylase family glycosyl hydrolase [Haliscomenobacter sp.]HOY18279.1 alpha-amylase family glycosyl hydrolase [Haliscomenobacter sp.]